MKITRGFRFIPNIHSAKKMADVVVEKTQEATESVIEHVSNVVEPVTKVVTEKVTETTTISIEKLESTKRFGIFVSTGKRFFTINGVDLAGLLTLEFFTVIIPIIILGIGGLSGFDKKLNIGDVLVQRLGISGDAANILHSAFPTATDLKSYYTFFGLLSFFIWGIPLAIQVGRIFATAYDSRRFTLGKEITRGVIWFVLFLVTLGISRIVPVDGSFALDALALTVRISAVFIFWVFTPALLVRDGIVGMKFLLFVGFISAIIDGAILPLIYKTTMPMLLNSWDKFGSIGVSMTIATWCAITTTTWVLIACFGGELAQRHRHDDLATIDGDL